jgi:hypothetical protein
MSEEKKMTLAERRARFEELLAGHSNMLIPSQNKKGSGSRMQKYLSLIRGVTADGPLSQPKQPRM